jgi:hypothetical protein
LPTSGRWYEGGYLMKEIMKEAVTMMVKLFVMYVFTMTAMLALVTGIAMPVLGVGGLVISIIVLSMLSGGGKAHDSGRNEDGT